MKTLNPANSMPEITVAGVDGSSIITGGKNRWQLIIVYRGKHCPLCKVYLQTLESMKDAFANMNVGIVAMSADPLEKAKALAEELKLTIPIGYGLTMDQMRTLGLYISNPRDAIETDRPFAEPGLFVVNTEGLLQAVDRSNAPWLRPDLAVVARGIAIVQSRLPQIRGTAQ